MTDREKGKRAGTFAGDAERAAVGAVHRQAEAVPHEIGADDSLPIIVDNHDDHTPVQVPIPRVPGRRHKRTVQEFAEETKLEIRSLRAEVIGLREDIHAKDLAAANRTSEVATATSVLAQRVAGIAQLGESIEELRQLKTEVAQLRVTVIGEDGDNGKVGTLRADHERTSEEVTKAITDAVAAVRREIWGDEIRKATDPPVVVEARRGKWVLRGLAGLALAAMSAAGYIVKDAVHNDAAATANVAANRDDIRVLQSQIQLLFSKMTLGSGPK